MTVIKKTYSNFKYVFFMFIVNFKSFCCYDILIIIISNFPLIPCLILSLYVLSMIYLKFIPNFNLFLSFQIDYLIMIYQYQYISYTIFPGYKNMLSSKKKLYIRRNIFDTVNKLNNIFSLNYFCDIYCIFHY